MMYEFVITDGPGTLIEHGVVKAVAFTTKAPKDMQDIAVDAICEGLNFQAERCAEDCGTGE